MISSHQEVGGYVGVCRHRLLCVQFHQTPYLPTDIKEVGHGVVLPSSLSRRGQVNLAL